MQFTTTTALLVISAVSALAKPIPSTEVDDLPSRAPPLCLTGCLQAGGGDDCFKICGVLPPKRDNNQRHTEQSLASRAPPVCLTGCLQAGGGDKCFDICKRDVVEADKQSWIADMTVTSGSS